MFGTKIYWGKTNWVNKKYYPGKRPQTAWGGKRIPQYNNKNNKNNNNNNHHHHDHEDHEDHEGEDEDEDEG